MDQNASARCEFWEERYQANSTPWDTQGVPSPTLEFLRQTALTGSVLIPGCGPAYEVQAFHDFGWSCLGIDFAPTTVQQARNRLGPLAPCVRQADFFHDDLGGPYDFMRRALASERGGELYSQRQWMVEPVFADIKHNRRAGRFKRRGRAAVRSEWRLIAATHNLLKLHRQRLRAATG